jgi:hypothetical protein
MACGMRAAAHTPAHEEKLDPVKAEVGMLLDDEVLDLNTTQAQGLRNVGREGGAMQLSTSTSSLLVAMAATEARYPAPVASAIYHQYAV